MILYTSGGIWYFLKLFQIRGSVFPSAMAVAFPCTLLAGVLRFMIDRGDLGWIGEEDSILKETQAWAGFSFLVGFLVVFRTSQAYSRFWDGSAATHRMRAEWFDACSSLMAFCRHSIGLEEEVSQFQNVLVRLFSMLHACALAELEEVNAESANINEVHSMHFDLIDPQGLDEDTLLTIKHSTSKVELIFTWIQFTIVDNIKTGVLAIPPPILSRSFQEIANGMVAFHDAIKISYIPFPFPYAQTCDCLLVLHWLVVPFVTSQWVTKYYWAAVFVFIQVFILWSLNFIAVEIENPFGVDANDLDGAHMQKELNRHLMLLLQTETLQCPSLSPSAVIVENCPIEEVRLESFIQAWDSCQSDHNPAALTSRLQTCQPGNRSSAAWRDEPWSSRALAAMAPFRSSGRTGTTVNSESSRPSRLAATLEHLNIRRPHHSRNHRFRSSSREFEERPPRSTPSPHLSPRTTEALAGWTQTPSFPGSAYFDRKDTGGSHTSGEPVSLTSSAPATQIRPEEPSIVLRPGTIRPAAKRPASILVSHDNSHRSSVNVRFLESDPSDTGGRPIRSHDGGLVCHASGPTAATPVVLLLGPSDPETPGVGLTSESDGRL